MIKSSIGSSYENVFRPMSHTVEQIHRSYVVSPIRGAMFPVDEPVMHMMVLVEEGMPLCPISRVPFFFRQVTGLLPSHHQLRSCTPGDYLVSRFPVAACPAFIAINDRLVAHRLLASFSLLLTPWASMGLLQRLGLGRRD